MPTLIDKSPYDITDQSNLVEKDKENKNVFSEFSPRKVKIGDLLEWINADNLAFDLSEDELELIGQRCKAGFERDKESNSEKFERIKQAETLANMESINTNVPWDGAADTTNTVIIELLIEYYARMLLAFTRNDQIAKYKISGEDKDGAKAEKAQRRGEYVSYFLLNHVDDFLNILGMVIMQQGCNGKSFMRCFYDGVEDKIKVEGIHTQNLVADAYMRSVKSGGRYTHIFHLYGHEIEEKIRTKEFIRASYKMGGVRKDEGSGTDDTESSVYDYDDIDATLSYRIGNQYCRIDLDKDGYPEPYIVVFLEDTGRVLRIKSCFDETTVYIRLDRENVNKERAKKTFANYELLSISEYLKQNPKTSKDEEVFIAKIDRMEDICEIPFLPNVRGNFYGVGLGEVFTSTVNMINRLSNALINSAESSNFRGGFMTENIEPIEPPKEGGNIPVEPNSYVRMQYSGQDISKDIYEYPRHEPSPFMYEMRNQLINEVKEAGFSTNMMQGQLSRGNVAAETVARLIEQGMQKYSAVMKLTYIGFREFLRIFDKLLTKYPPKDIKFFDSKGQFNVLKEGDLDNDSMMDIYPVADENDLIPYQKIMKAQMLLNAIQFIGSTGGNVHEVIRRYVESINIPNSAEIMPPNPQPQLNPAMLDYGLKQDELSLKGIETYMKLSFKEDEVEMEILKTRALIAKIYADATLSMAQAEAQNPGEQYTNAINELETYKKREQDMSKKIDYYKKYQDLLNNMIVRLGSGQSMSQEGVPQDGEDIVRQGEGNGVPVEPGSMVNETGNPMVPGAGAPINNQPAL